MSRLHPTARAKPPASKMTSHRIQRDLHGWQKRTMPPYSSTDVKA
jgi:hypothetical protein